ncbi:filamin A-interacting protein 1-like isoform X2 [Littorina saxatilis]
MTTQLSKMTSPGMRGGKRTRPLGSLRHMIAPDDTKVQIPKLSISPKNEEEEKKEIRLAGVQGNAMAVPPPKETSRIEEKRRPTPGTQREPIPPKSASNSSTSAVSHEACEKDLKEVLGREKDLKERIAQLQRQVEQLTTKVGEKDQVILAMTTDMETMEENYKQKLEKEKSSHRATRDELDAAQLQIQEGLRQLEALEKESREKMDLIRLDFTRQLNELREAKDKEIADRDQKLNRLKMQMADALKGNSWERQQQLEELTKDLARIQEECDMLRSKLKALSKGKPGQCGNCAESASRAEKLAVTVKEREMAIKELKTLCAKFEKQLSQQDVLLKQWADSKGHKIA